MSSCRLILLGLSFISLMACSSKTPVHEQESAELMVEKKQTKEVWVWEYEGPKGPQNWSQLNKQYDMCSSGKMQSPINLIWHRPSKPNTLKINYKDAEATLINTGYTFRLELTPENSISFMGKDYILEKIEFRTPSEHTLSGNKLPMELQLYHRSSNGLKQAIISVFTIAGRGSPLFLKLWKIVGETPKFKSSKSFRFNPRMLIPPRETYYHYVGSLTHPPCLEGVQWLVFNTPIQMSKEQIYEFRSFYNNNNRPVQPINGRPIVNY